MTFLSELEKRPEVAESESELSCEEEGEDEEGEDDDDIPGAPTSIYMTIEMMAISRAVR